MAFNQRNFRKDKAKAVKLRTPHQLSPADACLPGGGWQPSALVQLVRGGVKILTIFESEVS